MHTHTATGPQLFDRCLAARLLQLQRATAAAVGRRDEENVVSAPQWLCDVQAPIALVWVFPEQFAVIGIQSDNVIGEDCDELVLPINLDERRRRGRKIEI